MYTQKDISFPFNIPNDTRFFVIIGFALNGPVDTPFFIHNDVDPYEVLGDCRMAENYLIAKQNGINPLLIRLNGAHGEVTLSHKERGKPFLRFKTIEARDECNNISIKAFTTHLVVEGLKSKKIYYFKDYTGTSDLAQAIERDMYYGEGEVEVEVLENYSLTTAFHRDVQYFISGADDGYNLVMNHDGTDSDHMISAQLDVLEEKLLDIDPSSSSYFHASELDIYSIDTLLFTDIPYERAPLRLVEILGKFAESKTNSQNIHCSVVLCSDLFAGERVSNLESEYGLDNYMEQISQLIECSTFNIYGEHLRRGESIRYGEEDLLAFNRFLRHVEVVVGIQENVDAVKETMPCAASFAATRYNLPFHVSATNKPLIGANTLYSNHLLKDEVANLSSNGYTLCVPSKLNGIVSYSSKNLLPHFNSFRTKPHYLRSVCLDVYRITRLFDEHIGESNKLALVNTIADDVVTLIDEMKETPIYRDITVELLEITQETIRFAITFEMYGEVESVKTSYEFTPTSEVIVEWN